MEPDTELAEMQQELENRHEQLRKAEFSRMAAVGSLRIKLLDYGIPDYDDIVGVYLSGDYAQSRELIDMCILNNSRSEDNLNSNAYNLIFALDCYYKQLERIKLLQTQIETLQALIDSSL
jgi:hypothetical protein